MPVKATAPPLPIPSPRLTRIIAAVLLALMAVLLISSVRQESQTFDEAVHLFAGFEYWRHADFGRNPEHPPFAKMLAAAPLLSMHLAEPAPLPYPYFKAKDNMEAIDLLYRADADKILLRGRLVIVLFSLGLGLLVFCAAREMFGDLAALLALALFVLEPVLLANGALVTTDMPLACLFFAAVYAFFRYGNRPSLPRLLLTAVLAMLAIATKHSGVLILPTLAVLAAIDLWGPRSVETATPSESKRQHALRLVYALALILAVSYLGLWAFYGFRFAARPGQLGITPPLAAYAAGLAHPLHQAVIFFLARHHILPEAYLFGWVDILLISGVRTSFVFGRLYSAGQWFFLPGVFLIKSTLFLLILLVLVPFAPLSARRRELWFLAAPALVFVLAGVVSRVNLGVRHILPVYPFCLVLAAAAGVAFAARSRIAQYALAAGLLLTVVSSLHAFPDFLAYSNEAAGGPAHTYRLVNDSNDDWGQDLKWTRAYLDRHPAPDCWYENAIPFVPVNYYGIHCRPLPNGMGHMIGIPSGPIPPTISGTLLLSSVETSGLYWGPGDLNPYAQFRDRAPDERIGDVVLVYHGTFHVPLLAAQSNATLATTLMRAGQIPAALGLARAAAAEAPQSAEVNAVLGQAFMASGRVREGQQALGTALALARTHHPEFQGALIAEIEHPAPHP